MEYYSAIKRNASESVLMRWMNPEPIIQNEVSEKEKNKHCILTHTYEILKDGTMNLFAGQQWRLRHREQTCRHRIGKKRAGRMERVAWKCTSHM